MYFFDIFLIFYCPFLNFIPFLNCFIWFVSGYPVWIDLTDASAWEKKTQQEAFAYYLDQSVEINGSEFADIIETVREANVFTYLGVVERAASGGSIYCSLVAIDPREGVVSVHRKLKPTYGERLVWWRRA